MFFHLLDLHLHDPRSGRRTSFELLEKRPRLEVLGHVVVETRDHFINLLLPARVGVLAQPHGLEELAQRLLDHPTKANRNLIFKSLSQLEEERMGLEVLGRSFGVEPPGHFINALFPPRPVGAVGGFCFVLAALERLEEFSQRHLHHPLEARRNL